MRVSDRASARNYLKYLNQAKSAYAKTNEQIASGNRFERISDDVSAGTRVMRTRMDLYKSQKHLDNVQSVNEELSMAEDTMTSMQDILTNIHALTVKAASEEKGDAARSAIANEIKSLKGQFLSLSNSKYGQKYLFGGSNASLTSPFEADGDGRLLYNGIDVSQISQDADGYFYLDTDGSRRAIPRDENVYLDIGLGVRMKESRVDPDTAFLVSYSGLDIMGFGTDPETGLPNNLYNLLTDLETAVRSNDQEMLGKCDTQLTSLTDRFRANLTDIGSKTNFLDTMETRLKSTVDSHKIRISNLMGTDDVEASTQQTMNDYVLKAVIQMGARILPVSLMDFLR